jgi:hypothetical protein
MRIGGEVHFIGSTRQAMRAVKAPKAAGASGSAIKQAKVASATLGIPAHELPAHSSWSNRADGG